MRDIVVLGALALAAATIAALLFWGNGGALPGARPSAIQAAPTGSAVSFTVLASGAHSSVSARTNFILTSTDELRQLWAMTDAAGQVPNVDFSKYDVIAVFAGQEPTAGYAISVASVVDQSASRLVSVELTKPGGTCVVSQIVTEPYQIIALPKTTLPLTHADASDTSSCLE